MRHLTSNRAPWLHYTMELGWRPRKKASIHRILNTLAQTNLKIFTSFAYWDYWPLMLDVVNKNTCGARYLQLPYPPLLPFPPLPPQTVPFFLSSILPPPTSCPPQWCNIPTTNTFQHLYKDTKFYCCKEKATCTCVAVLGGNQTLFCCIFRPHYQTLQQKSHWGQCSYTLCRLIRCPYINAVHEPYPYEKFCTSALQTQ